jgi:hypothetical protein
MILSEKIQMKFWEHWFEGASWDIRNHAKIQEKEGEREKMKMKNMKISENSMIKIEKDKSRQETKPITLYTRAKRNAGSWMRTNKSSED